MFLKIFKMFRCSINRDFVNALFLHKKLKPFVFDKLRKFRISRAFEARRGSIQRSLTRLTLQRHVPTPARPPLSCSKDSQCGNMFYLNERANKREYLLAPVRLRGQRLGQRVAQKKTHSFITDGAEAKK